MGALPGSIGPVSVRYAAQIRELLQSHAHERLVAEQEAARTAAQADKAERLKPLSKPAKAALETKPPTVANPASAEAPEQSAATAPAQIVDIQV